MRAAGRTHTDANPSNHVSLRTRRLVGAPVIRLTVLVGCVTAGLAGCSNDAEQAVIVAPSAAGDRTDLAGESDSLALDGTGLETGNYGSAGAGEVLDTIPEVGVPGLGADDAFCAAWSEWAGSQQVIAVTANFSDPVQVPSLEVAASPTLVGAYNSMLENWPASIEAERDVAANDYFGPAQARAEVALNALTQAGADPATVAAIQQAWYQALEKRDPTTPEFTVDLSDEAWTYIDAAAATFAAQVRPRQSDESLLITANTDAIDLYIADTCPDRGTLAGLDATAAG